MRHADSDRGRLRLGRGHRDLGKRRCDEPMQTHLADTGHEAPWYGVAADRARWNLFELAFVARVTRC